MTEKLRIGAVSYLNTKALVYGLEQGLASDRIELSYAVPAELARSMASRELDVALMPIVALAEMPDLELVPGLSISTFGACQSVLLVGKPLIADIRTVALDPESRTSNILVQLLFEDYWKQSASFVPGEADLNQNLETLDAAVRIGDKALFARQPAGRHVYDLGEAWTRHTGLPFVFAAWFARPGVIDREVYQALHRSRRDGARHVKEIAASYSWNGHQDPALAETYLREHIHHRLGAREMEAIRRFLDRAAELELIRSSPEIHMAFPSWSQCHKLAAGSENQPFPTRQP